MPHSIGVGATLVALNREAEASPTQFFPASVRHYRESAFLLDRRTIVFYIKQTQVKT